MIVEELLEVVDRLAVAMLHHAMGNITHVRFNLRLLEK